MEDRIDAIERAILELAEALRQVCEKVAAIDEEVDKLGQSDVYGRLEQIENDFGGMVGGFNDILDGRKKRRHGEEFGTKYPQFGKYSDIGKRFGLDIVDIASNKAYEYDNSDGANDEGREAMINEMLSDLSAKFDDLLDLMGKQEAHESAESPAQEMAEQGSAPTMGVEIEIEKKPEDSDELSGIREAARKYRNARAG